MLLQIQTISVSNELKPFALLAVHLQSRNPTTPLQVAFPFVLEKRQTGLSLALLRPSTLWHCAPPTIFKQVIE